MAGRGGVDQDAGPGETSRSRREAGCRRREERLDKSAIAKLRGIVEAGRRFRHVTHVNPDADGLGSALAMSRWLRAQGKDSSVLLVAPPPRRLRFLFEDDEVELAPDGRLPPDGSTAYLVYDISTLQRLGPLADAVRASATTPVVLDHHDGEVDFPAIEVVDPDAGATAQVLFEVLDAWGETLSPEVALPLYVALLSDTGSFNYGKTSPRTHEIAGRLLAAGVDPLAVHGQLTGHEELPAMRVAGKVMATLELDPVDPRIAHATLRHELWREAGAEALDAVGLVNTTIAIEGVVAGVLFIEVEPAVTRLSLRSTGTTSILESAKSFGGGGHANAAGATLHASSDSVREPVLEALRREIAAQHGPPPTA